MKFRDGFVSNSSTTSFVFNTRIEKEYDHYLLSIEEEPNDGSYDFHIDAERLVKLYKRIKELGIVDED